MIALTFNKFSACCTRQNTAKILYASSMKFICTFHIWRDEKDITSWEITGKRWLWNNIIKSSPQRRDFRGKKQ